MSLVRMLLVYPAIAALLLLVVTGMRAAKAQTMVEAEIFVADTSSKPGTGSTWNISEIEPFNPSTAVFGLSSPHRSKAKARTQKADPNEIAQVTSVSQLSDVQPNDWAFQAIRLLVKRYKCIAGYPDQTFWGDRPATRYELAAAINACLNQITEQFTTAEDLATIQRLQVEFAAELAILRGGADALEARTTGLEAKQFSTTTKLTGQIVSSVGGGAFSGERIVDPTGTLITNENPNVTTFGRAALDFDTSFNGTDLLKLRIDSGSARTADNAAGLLEPTFGSVLDFSYRSSINGQFAVSRLNYTFTPLRDISVSFGPVISVIDYVDRNSYANLSFLDFSTQALVNNYILFPVLGLGAGAAIDWNPGEGPFSLRAVYVAADAGNANPNRQDSISNVQRQVAGVSPLVRLLYPDEGGNRGLFDDPNQGTIELEYAPSNAFALRLQYSGGNVFDGRFDVFGVNFELALSQQLAIFGRYGNGSYDDTAFGHINPNYWMAGISFQDLFVPSALAGIAAGQPFAESAVGNATQTNFEAFYNFPLNNNIRITPFVQVILDPSNQSSNGTIVTGTLRTVFSF